MGRPRRNTNTLLGNINRSYVHISNRVTEAYTEKYGFFCDLYFPKHIRNPKETGEYIKSNLFEPHEQCHYDAEPNVRDVKFYIPYLLKRENMNSDDLEFDPMYQNEADERPFIECSKKQELPIQTKVVVHIGESKMQFFVDLKTVVNGAGGHMLLRQYLAPILEDGGEEYYYG